MLPSQYEPTFCHQNSISNQEFMDYSIENVSISFLLMKTSCNFFPWFFTFKCLCVNKIWNLYMYTEWRQNPAIWHCFYSIHQVYIFVVFFFIVNTNPFASDCDCFELIDIIQNVFDAFISPEKSTINKFQTNSIFHWNFCFCRKRSPRISCYTNCRWISSKVLRVFHAFYAFC